MRLILVAPTQNGFPDAESFYQSVFDLGWSQVIAFVTACIGAVVVLKVIQSLSGR